MLKLGCSGGGNLIPLAERFPECEFVGIDASVQQVVDGQAAERELGLGNVRVEHRDILAVGPEFGTFGYVVCHGVYSWVPPAVQARILDVFRANLAAGGVAYVSYNA